MSRIPGVSTRIVVHASRFTLLGSCSGSLLGSEFGVRYNLTAASRDAWCYPCSLLLAAYAHSGRKDDVQALRERLSGYLSSMTVDGELSYWPFKDPADAERLAEGLRRAGLPNY